MVERRSDGGRSDLSSSWSEYSETDTRQGAVRRDLQHFGEVGEISNRRSEKSDELALRRFSLGCSRQDPSDALVNFVIVLEALLLPGLSRSEMAFRFRLHGAHYMAAFPGERSGIERQLRELYDVRSSLVHGGAPPSPESVASAVERARCSRRGATESCRRGLPRRAFFQRLLLGEP